MPDLDSLDLEGLRAERALIAKMAFYADAELSEAERNAQVAEQKANRDAHLAEIDERIARIESVTDPARTTTLEEAHEAGVPDVPRVGIEAQPLEFRRANDHIEVERPTEIAHTDATYGKAIEGVTGLHPAITGVLRHFEYDHLPENLQAVSKEFFDLAMTTATRAPQDPETTIALRKLLEAKDAAVRAAR